MPCKFTDKLSNDCEGSILSSNAEADRTRGASVRPGDVAAGWCRGWMQAWTWETPSPEAMAGESTGSIVVIRSHRRGYPRNRRRRSASASARVDKSTPGGQRCGVTRGRVVPGWIERPGDRHLDWAFAFFGDALHRNLMTGGVLRWAGSRVEAGSLEGQSLAWGGEVTSAASLARRTGEITARVILTWNCGFQDGWRTAPNQSGPSHARGRRRICGRRYGQEAIDLLVILSFEFSNRLSVITTRRRGRSCEL